MLPPDNKALSAFLVKYIDFGRLYAQAHRGVVRDDIPDIGILYDLHLPAVLCLHKIMGGDSKEYAAAHNGRYALLAVTADDELLRPYRYLYGLALENRVIQVIHGNRVIAHAHQGGIARGFNGTVKDVASDSMTLEVDGEDYKVLTGNAYVVGKDGIQTGAAAEVTYLGDLDDEPLAIKIVMDDAKDTDEAQINAFVGKVAQLGEDGDHIVLEAQTGDFFTFVSDSIDLSQYAEGDTLQIQYDGSINDKEIKAVKITKK